MSDLHIGWPQGIMLALYFLGICVTASKNGQPRTGHHDLGSSLFASGLGLALLWWGGFFS